MAAHASLLERVQEAFSGLRGAATEYVLRTRTTKSATDPLEVFSAQWQHDACLPNDNVHISDPLQACTLRVRFEGTGTARAVRRSGSAARQSTDRRVDGGASAFQVGQHRGRVVRMFMAMRIVQLEQLPPVTSHAT
jgi:hypothetical protein